MTVAADRIAARLEDVLARLGAAYGNETWHWDPAYVRGPMDVIAGAVLVQHTTWRNAERALENLRDAGALDVDVIATLPEERLCELVRVSGTPSIKARRLRALAGTIRDASGLDAFLELPDAELRARLLATHGVGRETADAIMLYAAGRRTFLIDAYTQRVFERIGVAPAGSGYDAWQRFFEEHLPFADVAAFQRHHAHIVLHAKSVCRARPLCGRCPLAECCDGAESLRLANDGSGRS